MEKELEKILDYVMNHKSKDKVFKGWSRDQLKFAILRAIKQTAFIVFFDGDDIKGIVFGEPDYIERKLRVVGIIADAPEVLFMFLVKYEQLYGGWEIVARRRGKDKIYNLKTIDRLWNNTKSRIYSLSLT